MSDCPDFDLIITGCLNVNRKACLDVEISYQGSSGGPGGPNQQGTLEGFRLVVDGVTVWQELGLTYPNWAGNTINNLYIPPVVITIPPNANIIQFYLLENSNGYPVSPGPIYPPYTMRTVGTSWSYSVLFSDGVLYLDNNATNFKYSPPAGNSYWSNLGQIGVETLVWTRTLN